MNYNNYNHQAYIDSNKLPKCIGEWNGYRIAASDEAWDLLITEGYTPYSDGIKHQGVQYHLCEDSTIVGVDNTLSKPTLFVVNGNLSATPLPWYLDESNYGKLIMARDDGLSTWMPVAFDHYMKEDGSCFMDLNGEVWIYARPATMDDISLIK